MEESSHSTNKRVQFANAIVEYDAGYTLDEEDIELMFFTNTEVNEILRLCKEQNELPLFWRSLRVHRTELLWDEIEKEQYHQQHDLDEEQAEERDLMEDLARVSRRISQPQQRMAAREAKKIEQEVEDYILENIHKTSPPPAPKKDLESPSLGGLHSISRNSIAAGVA